MGKSIGAKACDFVLFGTKGDLARRKLLPSLYQLDKAELLDKETKVIGVAKDAFTQEEFIALVTKALNTFVKDELCPTTLARFLSRCHYIGTNFKDPEGYRAFHDLLEPSKRVMVNYFATPPSIFGVICRCLHAQNLIQSDTRVVLEKPIGTDLESSHVINNQVAEFFNENQVYRIDHYLPLNGITVRLIMSRSRLLKKWVLKGVGATLMALGKCVT
jgi:glucose-6-phosphate 1-dehydrogenase